MQKEIENPNAFPSTEHGIDNRTGLPTISTSTGMTLRDYFAAKAMQGELSGQYASTNNNSGNNWPNEIYLSDRAYIIADAMLKARQK